jgi:hypothetical protein
MTQLAVDRPRYWLTTNKLIFGAALASPALVFGVFVPWVAYHIGVLQADFDAPFPRLALVIIDASPWFPRLIAILVIVALVAIERPCEANVSSWVNITAICSVVILGAITIAIVALPAMTLMQSLSIPGN